MFSDIDTAVKYSRDDVLQSRGACERQFVFCIWSFMKNVPPSSWSFERPWERPARDLPSAIRRVQCHGSQLTRTAALYTLWFEWCDSDLSALDCITSTLFMQIKISLMRCPFFYSKGQLSETLFLGQNAQPISVQGSSSWRFLWC